MPSEKPPTVLCRYENENYPETDFERTTQGLIHKGVEPRHNSDGETLGEIELPTADIVFPPDE